MAEPELHSVVTSSLPQPHTASLEHTRAQLLLLRSHLLQCSVRQFNDNINCSLTHRAHRSFFQFCSCQSSEVSSGLKRRRHATSATAWCQSAECISVCQNTKYNIQNTKSVPVKIQNTTFKIQNHSLSKYKKSEADFFSILETSLRL